MSTLYQTKIRSLKITSLPIPKLVEMSYHAMEDNFRTGLRGSGLDLSGEPHKIKAPRLMELLQKIKETEGIETLRSLSMFHWEDRNQAYERLRESYQKPDNLLHYHFNLVKNNMFYTVLGEPEKVLPVLLVNVEIISVHPDAGFPRYRMNPNCTMSDERKFLLRVLSNTVYEIDKEHPIVKESYKPTKFDPSKAETDPDHRMDTRRIIWGFERHKGLKIKPASNKAFWERNKDRWWSDLKDYYFSEKSSYRPYELVTYDIMVHPGWEKVLSRLVDVRVDSTAYWT